MFIFGVASLSLIAVSGKVINKKQYKDLTACENYPKFSTWDTHEEHARCQAKMGEDCVGFNDCGTKDEDYEALKEKCLGYDAENPLDWCVWLGGGQWEKQLYPCKDRGPGQFCARSPPGKCRMVITCPNGDQYNTCFGTMCHEEAPIQNPQVDDAKAARKIKPTKDECTAIGDNKKLCNSFKYANCVFDNKKCIPWTDNTSYKPTGKACKRYRNDETMCVLMGCRYHVAKGGKKKKCLALK